MHRSGMIAGLWTAAWGLALAVAGAAWAAPLQVVTVAPGIHAIVGPLGQRDGENLGNNATFGAIETDDGVVLVDAGGSRRGAEAIAEALRSVIDKPVVAVVNTGGQDHRWLGNGFFREKGAALYASAAAIADQTERVDMQFMVLKQLIGAEGLTGTEPVYAENAVGERTSLRFGETEIVLIPVGKAHTPGEMMVWLPAERIVFAGDVVFLDRLLGVLPFSSSAGWLEAFATMKALAPAIVVPGHGRPAPLEKAQAQTRDYLAGLRDKIGALIEAGGEIQDAPGIDQSAHAHLPGFADLAGRNAQAVYQEMEWE